MADASEYTNLVTSQHADKPKFMASIALVGQGFADIRNAAESLIPAFDLDQAQGDQLDTIGLWVGIGRRIQVPITGVYFSYDIAGVGLDQGVWKGKFDPDTGVVVLDDGTFRILIRAKIAANHWDGTLGTISTVLNAVFANTGTTVYVVDNGDMSITFNFSGAGAYPLLRAVIQGGYIPVKPAGVQAKYAFS